MFDENSSCKAKEKQNIVFGITLALVVPLSYFHNATTSFDNNVTPSSTKYVQTIVW